MIIVTGGAGFIGSALVWELNRRGREDIVVVDHLVCSDKWKNLVPLRFLDYLEKDDFLALVRAGRTPAGGGGVEAILHMGACSATTELDATYLVRNNYEYTKELALYALQQGARFIYASSAATYGDGAGGFGDDETALATLRPLNIYGYSKQLFDLWARQNGLLDRVAGLKFFNVFGPNEQHKGEMRSLVAKAYEQIVATGRLGLFKSHRDGYADGEQQRDFVYVKDAVAMALHFLQHPGCNGLFNIGSGRAQTWNSLARAIFMALDRPLQIDYLEMPAAVRDKYQYYTCADTAKLRAAGYAGEATPLTDSVRDYVVNYLVPGKQLGA
ncbi:MAG: ADP-glyceromanno-heptose 6-epimerase [Geobacter sp.]|nr:ADP-glyceromanno-heptose 6-epimerase [Geobacter sp.]